MPIPTPTREASGRSRLLPHPRRWPEAARPADVVCIGGPWGDGRARETERPEEPRPRIVRPIRESAESFGISWPLRAGPNLGRAGGGANPLIHVSRKTRAAIRRAVHGPPTPPRPARLRVEGGWNGRSHAGSDGSVRRRRCSVLTRRASTRRKASMKIAMFIFD